MGSTRTPSRSGQLAALATVALWCSSFALIKHLVDAGLGAQDVAVGLECFAPRRIAGIALAFAGVVVVVVLGSGDRAGRPRSGSHHGHYVTWSIALRGLEPSRAISYLCCVPPLAVAIGALFLDEPVTLWLLLGGALVVGGVAVAQRRPARKAGIPPKACIERADGQRCRT